jgi:hypothetical protein
MMGAMGIETPTPSGRPVAEIIRECAPDRPERMAELAATRPR